MTRRARNFSGLVLGWLLVSLSTAADERKVDIVVELNGFEHDRGEVMLALYSDPDAFPTKPERAARRAQSPISGKRARVVLAGLPRKVYALSVFHDENGNGKLDTNLLGIPREPMGCSNNAKGSFGPPKWKDAKFSAEADVVTQKILMQRL